MGRAKILLATGARPEKALEDAERARRLTTKKEFQAHLTFLLCGALEANQRLADAKACIEEAAKLGHPLAIRILSEK
jgi:hypothetical protein